MNNVSETIASNEKELDLSNLKRAPVLVALLIGAFVMILNETLLNIAFPDLMIEFKISASTVQWLATAYMLVVGILVPVTALLQQWFTTRQMFFGAMTLFLIGTIVCSISPFFEILLVGRVIQALGTGLMMPVLMNTILIIFPPDNRGAAMGMIGLVIMSAPAIGPALSGLIIDALNWRWLFYLVIPLAVFSILFASAYLKNVSKLTRPKVDIVSIILSTIGFGGIVYGFSSVGEGSWTDPLVYWSITVGVIALILFVWKQLHMKEPMLNLQAFRYPMFSLVIVLMIIILMSLFSTIIMLPLFLINVLGVSALTAGLILMPGGIINGILAPISGVLFDKFGPKVLVIPGLVLFIVSLYLFSQIESTWTSGYVIFLHVLMMISIAMIMMPAQTTGLNQLPKNLYAHGTAIMNTMQQVSGAIGTALFISIMTSGATDYMESSLDPANPVELIEAQVYGFHISFLVGVFFAISAFALGLFIKKTKLPSEENEMPIKCNTVIE
ncbi:DHA2 family efflux MFS transporter permease subunit [Chengkuizengella sediminis]|uniref:DHA2 family efflux MFS transporter permease subunit n=1 Tax=Chengkuizengella sediminis TaxID=1885917 RepID=UPI003B82D619